MSVPFSLGHPYISTHPNPYVPSRHVPHAQNFAEDKPLPALPDEWTTTDKEDTNGKALVKTSSSNSKDTLLRGIKKVATLGCSTGSGWKKYKPPNGVVYVNKGTQTDFEGTHHSHIRSRAVDETRLSTRERRERVISRPSFSKSMNSFLGTPLSTQEKEASEKSSITTRHLPRTAEMPPTPFPHSLSYRATNLSLVGPNYMREIPVAELSAQSLGTYESRYSDRFTQASKVSDRPSISRRAESDSKLSIAPFAGNNAGPNRSPSRPQTSRASSTKESHVSLEGSLQRGSPSLRMTSWYGPRKIRRKRTSNNGSGEESSPLRQEIRRTPDEQPSPMKNKESRGPGTPAVYMKPSEGYFPDYEQMRQTLKDVPDHLNGSPLCPLHPKYHAGPQMYCPLHGQPSWGTQSSDESIDQDNESNEHKEPDISEDMRSRKGLDTKLGRYEHPRESPSCPANHKALGARAICAIHGRGNFLKSADSEDSVMATGIGW